MLLWGYLAIRGLHASTAIQVFPLFRLIRNIQIQPAHHNRGWISQFDSQLCLPRSDAVHQDGGGQQSHCLGQDSAAPRAPSIPGDCLGREPPPTNYARSTTQLQPPFYGGRPIFFMPYVISCCPVTACRTSHPSSIPRSR